MNNKKILNILFITSWLILLLMGIISLFISNLIPVIYYGLYKLITGFVALICMIIIFIKVRLY